MEKSVESEVTYEELSGDTDNQGSDSSAHPTVNFNQDAEAGAHTEVPEYQNA